MGMNIEEQKIAALKKYLGTDEDPEKSTWGDNTYDAGNQEWLVLTDEEADEAAEAAIEESVWAFRSEWLESHCDVPAKHLRKMQEDMCEDANPIVRRLIKDWDHFVEESVCADGRGHFLSSWDGEEADMGDFYGYRVN